MKNLKKLIPPFFIVVFILSIIVFVGSFSVYVIHFDNKNIDPFLTSILIKVISVIIGFFSYCGILYSSISFNYIKFKEQILRLISFILPMIFLLLGIFWFRFYLLTDRIFIFAPFINIFVLVFMFLSILILFLREKNKNQNT